MGIREDHGILGIRGYQSIAASALLQARKVGDEENVNRLIRTKPSAGCTLSRSCLEEAMWRVISLRSTKSPWLSDIQISLADPGFLR